MTPLVLTNYNLTLEHLFRKSPCEAAKSGKLVILSTGLSSVEEIGSAVDLVEKY